MNVDAERHNKARATARRELLGREDSSQSALTPTQAFNAGYDAGSHYVELPHGYDSARPNHYFHDGAGDPDLCEQDHNHPERIAE